MPLLLKMYALVVIETVIYSFHRLLITPGSVSEESSMTKKGKVLHRGTALRREALFL